MAIIVDKVQKRKDIALTCKELFVEKGIKNLTISQIAVQAGVGKGTLYDYFQNKEDIVFEIVNNLLHERNEKKVKKISEAKTTKAKIKVFFEFFYNDEVELRELYKEFISIALSEANPQMMEFQTHCFQTYNIWFHQILQAGIDAGEIIPESIKLTNGLFSMGEGIFISSCVTHAIKDVQFEIDNYLDTIFDLIEVKK